MQRLFHCTWTKVTTNVAMQSAAARCAATVTASKPPGQPSAARRTAAANLRSSPLGRVSPTSASKSAGAASVRSSSSPTRQPSAAKKPTIDEVMALRKTEMAVRRSLEMPVTKASAGQARKTIARVTKRIKAVGAAAAALSASAAPTKKRSPATAPKPAASDATAAVTTSEPRDAAPATPHAAVAEAAVTTNPTSDASPQPADQVVVEPTVAVVDPNAPQPEGYARSLACRNPKLASEYCPSNPVPVNTVLHEAPVPVKWRCAACDHTWTRSVFERAVLGSACPNCASLLAPALSKIDPKLSLELHPTKNDPFVTADVTTSANRSLLWWRCGDCQHEFQATFRQRVSGNRAERSCPQCAGKTNDESFQVLLQEWHPTKNGDMLPETAIRKDSARMKRMLWWICPVCSFEWQAPAGVRLRGYGACPQCDHSRSQISGLGKASKPLKPKMGGAEDPDDVTATVV